MLFKFVSSLKSESPAPTASAFQLWHVGGKEQEFAQHALPNLDADGNVVLPYVQCGRSGCIAAKGHKDEIEEKYNSGGASRLLREQCPLILSVEELFLEAIKSVAVYQNVCVKTPECVHGYHSRVHNTYILNGKTKNRLFFNVVVGRWVRELKRAVSGDAKKHFPHCDIGNGSAMAPTSTESLWRLALQNWRKKEQQQSQQQSEQQEGRPQIVVPKKNATTAPSPSPSNVQHHPKKLKLNEPSPVASPSGMAVLPSPSARPSAAKKARKGTAADDGLQSAAEEPSAGASQAVLAPTLDLVATDGSKSQSAEKTEAKKPQKRKKAVEKELAQLAIGSDGLAKEFDNSNRTASSRSEESKVARAIRESVVKAPSLVTSFASVNLGEVPPPPTIQAPLPSALCSLVLMLAGRRTLAV